MKEKFKIDQPIIITRRGSGSGSIRQGFHNRKGYIALDDEAESYPARRSKPESGIRIFDLGIKNGSTIDLFLNRPFDLSQSNPLNGADVTALYNQLFTQIFGVPLNDFGSRFYLIKKGDEAFEKMISAGFERSGTPVNDLLTNLPEWRQGSLIITETQAEKLVINLTDSTFNVGGLNLKKVGHDKMTETPDFDAPIAAFEPSAKMDIYLMPNFAESNSNTRYRAGLHQIPNPSGGNISDIVLYDDFLNLNFQIVDRSTMATYQQIKAITDGYSNLYAFWQFQTTLRHTRTFQIKETFQDSPPYSYVRTLTSGNAFPYSPLYQPSGINNQGQAPLYQYDLVHTSGFGGAGFVLRNYSSRARLKGVIHQSDRWLYVWQS